MMLLSGGFGRCHHKCSDVDGWRYISSAAQTKCSTFSHLLSPTKHNNCYCGVFVRLIFIIIDMKIIKHHVTKNKHLTSYLLILGGLVFASCHDRRSEVGLCFSLFRNCNINIQSIYTCPLSRTGRSGLLDIARFMFSVPEKIKFLDGQAFWSP